MMERRVEFDIYSTGGKDTKKKGKCFYICLDQPNLDLLTIFTRYKSFIVHLYEKGVLTEDDHGKKFFITCNIKTLEWNDTRMTTTFYTRIFRDRLQQFFSATNPNMSENEIENILKKYASHSMRRGGHLQLKRMVQPVMR